MEKSVDEFKQISTISDLLEFLKDKGSKHNYYHHYTSLDNAIKIINSNIFLLTRGNATCMNDQHECLIKGARELWDQTYVGSFSYGDGENMAMWGLYGLPWDDAVRISIPKKSMLNWISGIKKVYEIRQLNLIDKVEIIPFPRIVLSDIVYIEERRNTLKLYWSGSSIQLSNHDFHGIDKQSEMTGFIKNNAWRYENEVRIHIQLQTNIHTERIGVEIPPDLIQSLVITAGPYFSGDLLHRIREKIPQILSYSQVRESGFRHLVNYKSLCSMCSKGPFVLRS